MILEGQPSVSCVLEVGVGLYVFCEYKMLRPPLGDERRGEEEEEEI